MKHLLKEWKAWLANQDVHEPFLQLKLKEDDEEQPASPSHKKRKAKHVLKEPLKPGMQELIHSIQGLYDTKEQDFMEDMGGKLDLA